jgi:hypothetical protein
VLGTFAKEHATVYFQVPYQILALHSALFCVAVHGGLEICSPPCPFQT